MSDMISKTDVIAYLYSLAGESFRASEYDVAWRDGRPEQWLREAAGRIGRDEHVDYHHRLDACDEQGNLLETPDIRHGLEIRVLEHGGVARAILPGAESDLCGEDYQVIAERIGHELRIDPHWAGMGVEEKLMATIPQNER